MIEIRMVGDAEVGRVVIAKEDLPARRLKLIRAGYKFVGRYVNTAVKRDHTVRFVQDQPPVPGQTVLPLNLPRSSPARRASDFGEITSTNSQMLREEAEYNRAFAAQERAQEDVGFAGDPDFRASQAEKAPYSPPENQPQIAQQVQASRSRIQDMTYTIAYPNGTHRTLRFKTMTKGALKGKTVVSYLSGPNNTRDFTSCAFYDQSAGLCSIWARFRVSHNRELSEEILTCVGIILENPADAGEAYALKSGRCARCNRRLTVPASIHKGLGPECASKVSW